MTTARDLRVLFAGTPAFAAIPLETMIHEGFAPAAVFTQPDRPAGRGRALQASPVKQLALAAGIPVHQPASLRGADLHDQVTALAPDLMVVVAYGLILPPELLDIPEHGCWNLHASLLPRWRGAAPIQRAIEAGDEETGVCVMQMDAGLDTGPVIGCARIALDGSETAGSLHDRLAELGAQELVQCLRRLASGDAPRAEPQPATGASHARKLDKAEARIDWSEPAAVLERRVRAFDPWPVAWCRIGDERVRVWRSVCLPQAAEGPPGTVLASGPAGIDVATGAGVLRLVELQPPGKRRMSVADFLNSRSLPRRLAVRP